MSLLGKSIKEVFLFSVDLFAVSCAVTANVHILEILKIRFPKIQTEYLVSLIHSG